MINGSGSHPETRREIWSRSAGSHPEEISGLGPLDPTPKKIQGGRKGRKANKKKLTLTFGLPFKVMTSK